MSTIVPVTLLTPTVLTPGVKSAVRMSARSCSPAPQPMANSSPATRRPDLEVTSASASPDVQTANVEVVRVPRLRPPERTVILTKSGADHLIKFGCLVDNLRITCSTVILSVEIYYFE